jgi:hypothetical protein
MIVRINARRWDSPIVDEVQELNLRQLDNGYVELNALFTTGGASKLGLVLNRDADETLEVFGSIRDMENHDKGL